jgi:hypothetical protein
MFCPLPMVTSVPPLPLLQAPSNAVIENASKARPARVAEPSAIERSASLDWVIARTPELLLLIEQDVLRKVIAKRYARACRF